MKLNYIIVLGFLIAFSINYDSCAFIANPTSQKDCNDKLTDWDKENNLKYCCYREVETLKDCLPIDQATYDSIGETKAATSTATNLGNVHYKIECDSSYLKLGLLSLLFFIF